MIYKLAEFFGNLNSDLPYVMAEDHSLTGEKAIFLFIGESVATLHFNDMEHLTLIRAQEFGGDYVEDTELYHKIRDNTVQREKEDFRPVQGAKLDPAYVSCWSQEQTAKELESGLRYAGIYLRDTELDDLKHLQASLASLGVLSVTTYLPATSVTEAGIDPEDCFVAAEVTINRESTQVRFLDLDREDGYFYASLPFAFDLKNLIPYIP